MAVAPHCARPTDPGQAPNSPTVYYRRLPESALADLRLSRSALAVLAQLDGFARDKAECWPSVMTLAKALGLCRRTIQLSLTRLKTCGYIAEKSSTNPTGRVLILLWRTGGANAATPGAQRPYSQGLPPGRKPARPIESQSLERKKGSRSALFQTPEPEPIAALRPTEPRPTDAERAETLGEWLLAIPSDTPLARSLAARLAERSKV
ncbi:MAG TPA: helix-turn-helix domain-containing protein [Isosphaeraceae bacterium]|nr:helix-turn-helix domain-containing protein [Isosphaeraceae bacterium]